MKQEIRIFGKRQKIYGFSFRQIGIRCVYGSLALLLLLTLMTSCVQKPEEVVKGTETVGEISSTGTITGDDDVTTTTEDPPVQTDPTVTPPDTQSVATSGAHGVTVLFTQDMDKTKAETKANYVINGLTVVSATLDSANPRKVQLETSIQQKVTYTLLMVNLTNASGVTIPGGGIYRQFEGAELVEAKITWKDPQDTNTTVSAPLTNPAYNKNEIYVIVSGTNIVSYKYQIDGDAVSEERSVSEPLIISGLLDGSHTLKVWGKHNNGDWQETNYPTSHTWSQDTVAPVAQFVGGTLPSDPTDSQTINASVTGTSVEKYYYKFSFESSWSGPYLKNAQIQNGTPLPEGTVSVSIRGMDKSGNIQSEGSATTYTWVINASAPFSKLDGASLPPALSNQTSATVYVTGDNDVTHYKGKIFEADNCDTMISALTADFNDANYPETAISTPLTITGMSGPGSGRQYIVCVIGKNSLNKWQTLSAGTITKSTWIVDTDGMPATINWASPFSNPGTTSQQDFTFEMSGDGVASYGYGVVPTDGADCSSISQSVYTSRETAIDTALTLNGLSGNPQKTYTLCVKSKDGVGNWQNVATETSWTVDLVPPSSNPNISSSGSHTSLAITFTWSNTEADWAGYRIQVSKSTDFNTASNIVADAMVDRASGANTTFTYAVNPDDGASYYARIKTRDAQNNWNTGWGSISSEHYVVGHISGSVFDQVSSSSKSAINGITVSVFDAAGTDLTGSYPAVVTANDGSSDGVFTINNVRIGVNAYQLRFEGIGYKPTTKRNVTIQAGTTLSAGQNLVVSTSLTTNRTISGKVIDGNDGWKLGYAEVKLINPDGSTRATTRSIYSGTNCDNPAAVGDPPSNLPKAKFDSALTCGKFSFTNVPPGVYSIKITGDSWGSGNKVYYDLEQDNVAVSTANKNVSGLPIIETMTEPNFKVIITWGSANPKDLDFHVTGTATPVLSGSYDTWNSDSCTFPNYWGYNPGFGRENLFHVWAARPNVSLSWQQQFSAKDSIYIEPGTTAYNSQNYFPMSPAATTALVQDANSGFGPETINFLSGYKNGTYWFSVFNWGYWYYTSYGFNATTRVAEGWDRADNIAIRIYSAKGLELEIPFPVDQTSHYINESGDSDLGADPLVAGDGVTPTQKEYWRPFKMVITGPGAAGRQITVTPAASAFGNLIDKTGANTRDGNRCDQIW